MAKHTIVYNLRSPTLNMTTSMFSAVVAYNLVEASNALTPAETAKRLRLRKWLAGWQVPEAVAHALLSGELEWIGDQGMVTFAIEVCPACCGTLKDANGCYCKACHRGFAGLSFAGEGEQVDELETVTTRFIA